MPILEPKEITVKTLSGEDRMYVISKFPAIAGREIIAKYPLTSIPKLSDYGANEEVMLKVMCYVSPAGGPLLTTRALVDNHCPDWETLVKLEIEMIRYNTSFFQKGEISTFLSGIAKNWIASISPMLTASLAQFLEAAKLRLKSYARNTP